MSQPAGGLGRMDEVSGMLKWVRDLVRGPIYEDVVCGRPDRSRLTRQEMSELFSDILDEPALTQRTNARHGRPRRLTAGRRRQST